MGLRFRQQQHSDCFFITTTFKNWEKLGDIKGLYPAMADSLSFCASKYEGRAIGYVLMPSHIHLLMVISGDKLPGFMRDFKKFVAQKVAKELGLAVSQLWFPRYDRQVIYSMDFLRTKLSYIHNNPVKAGLVRNPEDWKWSSAGDYIADRLGVIPVWKDWM